MHIKVLGHVDETRRVCETICPSSEKVLFFSSATVTVNVIDLGIIRKGIINGK